MKCYMQSTKNIVKVSPQFHPRAVCGNEDQSTDDEVNVSITTVSTTFLFEPEKKEFWHRYRYFSWVK